MTGLTAESRGIVLDARAMFDYYLEATSGPSFRRIGARLADGNFWYPETTLQADAGAFAGAFNCLWRALENRATFDACYAEKRTAFDELMRIVTPNAHDPENFTTHARFWTMDAETSVVDARAARLLCRTLRNGFAHFNFRYIDVTPSNYFERMSLALPTHIPEPGLARNYRIFICDWKRAEGFMAPGSDTRIIETHFAHLRYHLFMFLARFFTEPYHDPYVDILTGETIA